MVCRPLSCEELARRDIKERHTAAAFAEMNCCQEVILLVVQHVIGHRHAWRHKFCDASLHQFLGEFRVFQLVANSHSPTRPDKFRQIGVESMMRESCHFGIRLALCPVVASCQRDAQNLTCRYSIVAVGLVEVAATEQQECVWMLRFQREELLHHGCQLFLFGSHRLCFL